MSHVSSGYTTGIRRFARNTLGKWFAECHTRQRVHGKKVIGKGLFAESFLSGTRQSLCHVLTWHSEKKSRRNGGSHGDGGFAECQGHGTRQKPLPLPRAVDLGTWQRWWLCRVTGPWHSAKHVFRWSLCRVLWPLHSAKAPFVECNTRQSDQK